MHPPVYCADSEQTASAELYRGLAERGLAPGDVFPGDLHHVEVDLTRVADLSTIILQRKYRQITRSWKPAGAYLWSRRSWVRVPSLTYECPASRHLSGFEGIG